MTIDACIALTLIEVSSSEPVSLTRLNTHTHTHPKCKKRTEGTEAITEHKIHMVLSLRHGTVLSTVEI